ncbi:hypothetical protein [Flavobacterium sp.]|uniref:hypothetical protein n=1 Tax=Flavobacterium sp. TaxID=239 RepID=UPI00260D18BC|nr:hypothetical protein [Flavobacterium sp.]
MATKTWQQKFDQRKEAEVKRIDKRFADIPENALMLIATPQIFADYIAQIPAGTLVSMTDIRKDLALTHGATHTCPVTTGIFLRIVAELNYEKYQAGTPLSEITPFWRAIAPTAPLAKKLSFGTDFLQKNLAAEQEVNA